MQISRHFLERGHLIDLVEPLHHAWIPGIPKLVENHHPVYHGAHGEEIRQREMISNQILALGKLIIQCPAIGVQGLQAVLGILAYLRAVADERKYEGADGREEVIVGKRHPFQDVVVVAAARAKECCCVA